MQNTVWKLLEKILARQLAIQLENDPIFNDVDLLVDGARHCRGMISDMLLLFFYLLKSVMKSKPDI